MISSAGLRKWMPSVLIVLVGLLTMYFIHRYRTRWKKEHVLIELKPFQTPKGWGYDILTDGHIYIHQDIIPAIPGEHGFRTKEDALAVGQKVLDRAMKGQPPMVTSKEVQNMGILPDTSSKK